MPRSLINVLGVIVTIGVLALGIALVAAPLALQALGVVGQTAGVATTNATYQKQIDALREEEKHLDETEQAVASLRTQITAADELDDVFELVATAAQSAGVTLTSVTAGESAAFVKRTAPTTIGEPVAPAPAEAPAADAAAGDAAVQPTPQDPVSDSGGRTQVDFTIGATAGNIGQVVAFLDGLRAGPRLLGQVQSTVTASGPAFTVTVTALTFVLPQEG